MIQSRKSRENHKKIKLLALAMAVAMLLAIPAAAVGEIDLSALTWEELLELKSKITMEQWEREEWQEVEVPQGLWVVGEDIPAGKWTVTCKTGYATTVRWGKYLDDSQTNIDYFRDMGDSETVYNPNDRGYDAGDRTEYTFEPPEGKVVVETGGIFADPVVKSFLEFLSQRTDKEREQLSKAIDDFYEILQKNREE